MWQLETIHKYIEMFVLQTVEQAGNLHEWGH